LGLKGLVVVVVVVAYDGQHPLDLDLNQVLIHATENMVHFFQQVGSMIK
jgi:hypothetical protein